VKTRKKVNRTFLIYEDNIEQIRDNLEIADVQSMNDFVNKAIEFYLGYLKTTDASSYLMNSVSSVLQAKLNMSEKRINGMIYKLAVEVAMQNRIIAYGYCIDEAGIDKIREMSEEEIRAIQW